MRKERNKDSYYRFMYPFIRLLARIVSKIFFRYKTKPISIDGPFILVSNHTTDLDPGIIMHTIKNHMYFVASEHVVRMKVAGPLVKLLIGPITVFKGSIKISGVRAILQTVKKGNSVALFPEGCRTFSGVTEKTDEAIGKMVKSAKCKLVTFRIKGGYMNSPRWGVPFRKGPVWGEVVRVISKEEISAMTPEDINRIITEDIYEDAYTTQEIEKKTYFCKNGAEGIEHLIFMCPQCGKTGTVYGKGNNILCSCGMQEEIESSGFITGKIKTLKEWEKIQKETFRQYCEKEAAPVIEDNGIVLKIIDKNCSAQNIYTGNIKGYKDRIEAGSHIFYYSLFDDIDQRGKGDNIMFTYEGVHYEISGGSFCGLKYRYMYDFTSSTQE